jgi:uncharacterized protein
MVNIREKDRSKGGIYSNYRKSKGKPVLYIAVLFVVILLMAVIYNPGKDSGRMIQNKINKRATSSSEPEFVKQGELTFFKSDSTVIVKIDIEIADDDAKRERGLMYRRQMEVAHGMLFIFPEEDLLSFWMKNTYLPLDILYINAQKKIVRICENAAPLSEQSIPSDFPAKYVVEVNAGFCALYNIRIGCGMSFVRR